MSNLDHFKRLAAPLPPQAVYDVRPILGLEREVDRTTSKGARSIGVSITVEILGGPFALAASPDNMQRGGDFAGRKLSLEFMTEAPFSGVVERDIRNLLKIAEALDVGAKLPDDASLLDLVTAIASDLTPTTKNPSPARLLLTIRRTSSGGRDYYAVEEAVVAALQPDIFK